VDDPGLARISQMLNVLRVVEEELHEVLIGEICDESGDDDGDDETVEIGEALILLGERIRLVNEPSFVELIGAAGEGGVGKGGDDDGFVFDCSSMLAEGTVVSNLSSLIRRDSNLEEHMDTMTYTRTISF
jgi:hypothetical protein